MSKVMKRLGISINKWISHGNSYESIVWKDKPLCTKAEWDKATIDEIALYDAQKYQRDRAKAYDPIPEQLDQIYHDMDGWKAKIKAVIDKYPKP